MKYVLCKAALYKQHEEEGSLYLSQRFTGLQRDVIGVIVLVSHIVSVERAEERKGNHPVVVASFS
jgi:hypothetical protein